MTTEDLIKIMHSGYVASLDHCFDGASLYSQGFIDGMKFQKDGTIPMSNLDRALKSIEIESKKEEKED